MPDVVIHVEETRFTTSLHSLVFTVSIQNGVIHIFGFLVDFIEHIQEGPGMNFNNAILLYLEYFSTGCLRCPRNLQCKGCLLVQCGTSRLVWLKGEATLP